MAVDVSDRQFAGNLGYADMVGQQYAWDSNIVNARRVQAGDLAVVRNKREVLGIGWIDEVTPVEGEKIQRRCPACKLTGFKPRKQLKPAFWCPTCKAAFDAPLEQAIAVTLYTAYYGRSWRPIAGEVASRTLTDSYIGGNSRHAIRQVDLGLLPGLLSGSAGVGPLWWASDGGVRPDITGGYRQILGRQRIGQAQFRAELKRRFGNRCAISGEQPPEILEAAHLYRYCAKPHHDRRGGLLLRRDLHALFDQWLIAIDTSTWIVQVAPQLLVYASLADMDGRPLDLSPDLRPDADYLDTHLAYARDAWQERSG
jgi:predicted Zn-ribbon and HTH transcriptional regulator